MAPKNIQEMPPPGGYAPVQFMREAPKPRWIKNKVIILGTVLVTVVNTAIYYGILAPAKWARKREMIENEICMEPFMIANYDRQLLKKLWQNREEENELMKDVPGWETGTWYGRPVYENPGDRFKPVSHYEVYAHDSEKAMNERKLFGREGRHAFNFK